MYLKQTIDTITGHVLSSRIEPGARTPTLGNKITQSVNDLVRYASAKNNPNEDQI